MNAEAAETKSLLHTPLDDYKEMDFENKIDIGCKAASLQYWEASYDFIEKGHYRAAIFCAGQFVWGLGPENYNTKGRYAGRLKKSAHKLIQEIEKIYDAPAFVFEMFKQQYNRMVGGMDVRNQQPIMMTPSVTFMTSEIEKLKAKQKT
jgi:hypothetical protein